MSPEPIFSRAAQVFANSSVGNGDARPDSPEALSPEADSSCQKWLAPSVCAILKWACASDGSWNANESAKQVVERADGSFKLSDNSASTSQTCDVIFTVMILTLHRPL